jgi:hypothetical protein
MVSGIVPDMLIDPIEKSLNRSKLPISEGIEPLIRKSPKYSSSRFTRQPMEEGIEPDILVEEMCIVVNRPNIPISCGIVPVIGPQHRYK